MGLLVNGNWQDKWYDTESNGGSFKRDESAFRNCISSTGELLEHCTPKAKHAVKAEANRFHLYVSYACPWAHRTLIVRALKHLEPVLPVTVVNPLMLQNGWEFGPSNTGFTELEAEPLYGYEFLHQLYTHAKSDYSGRVTVPVLWDTKEQTIVNNESSELIRCFNTAFDALGAAKGDFYPEPLRPQIDEINHRVYHTVNNGVYKAGFATSQTAYAKAVTELFESLDWLNEKLTHSRYLVGSTFTEADIRLFTTLLRFDPVYEGHFKCNLQTLREYSALYAYTREIYQMPGVAATCNMVHIQNHYYRSHPSVNPNKIVPLGPKLDLSAPHGREAL